MESADFDALIGPLMETIRESLAAIENAAQVDEDERLHALSRLYAELLTPLRAYLESVRLGHARPKRLAELLRSQGTHIATFEPLVQKLGLHPSPEELEALAAAALASHAGPHHG